MKAARAKGRFLVLVMAIACGCGGARETPASPPPQAVAIASAPPASADAAASDAAVPAALHTRSSGDPYLDAIGAPAMTSREREEWGAAITEQIAPCPNAAFTVAECLVENRGCARCVPAAKALFTMVQSGVGRAAIGPAYAARFDPRAVREIPIGSSPAIGPAAAPVTIVEFADFECPMCKQVAPTLAKLVESRGARLVHKAVALSMHPHARNAARAAFAADEQGKFWPMHDLLFEHREALEDRDLERYAKEIGLDVPRFLRAANSEATAARVDADQALWRSLGVEYTPAIFINGRLYVAEAGTLDEWVADALSARPYR